MTVKIVPFSLKDTPSLIEHVLPVQKLSAESYREQEGKQSKPLTTLGSYWKGRKPLILNRACVLGSLLPVTQPITSESLQRDLEVFEILLGMDEKSIAYRRGDLSVDDIPDEPYSKLIAKAPRPDQPGAERYRDIWREVNEHLKTDAAGFPQLIEQLGIMRFGHRPKVADTFCGSGQIPFEAARLGCETHASDLNPIACMLTWGAFNVAGAEHSYRQRLAEAQQELVAKVQAEIDALGMETDGHGWRPKTFLYCLETTCPQTGWQVPLLPTRLISLGRSTIAELIPDPKLKRYKIAVKSGVSAKELSGSSRGTVDREGRFGDAFVTHEVDGVSYRTKISTLRGDYERPDGTTGNSVRPWAQKDFRPCATDLFRERLYCVQWIRPKKKGAGYDQEFRTVTQADLERESLVDSYVAKHLEDWQAHGWVPDMRIEPGGPPRYEGLSLIRGRGWTHWHHVFSPRQLLFLGLTSKAIHERSDKFVAPLLIFLARLADWSSKLCRYGTGAARESVAQTFYNQALNTLYAYGVRSFSFAQTYLLEDVVESPIAAPADVIAKPAHEWNIPVDVYVTDPPYGDAVKYEEILDFFIAWLRKNPPPEFANWVWDSRRALAISGEEEGFRRGMVAAYRRMTELMPDNGLQIIMFTHQSGSIWADMANIVWASGLHVTAAWYVVTEIDSALREGSFVKGTVLLVLRKRLGDFKTGRDDLAWEIQDEVQRQVDSLTGLNQSLAGSSRTPNQFSDSDLQMAGYAAALRVLTRYSVIDGRQMAEEALRPRQKGSTTMVDDLIEFAVGVANNCLVPTGLTKPVWDRLRPVERFYLKLLELECRGFKTLDNYQNFAKAFKVGDFKPLMESQKANSARLKSSVEFGRAEMSGESELANTLLRGVLYALMELQKDVDGDEVLQHLSFNVEEYFSKRPMLVELCGFLAKQLTGLREDEASAARVLHDLIQNQRL